MATNLVLLVKDGPQIGRSIEIVGPKSSVGGKGSGADTELSGTPHGVELAKFNASPDGWTIAEVKPRTLLLNEKRFKRKNVLRGGDIIKMPSLARGQAIRYEVQLTEVEREKNPEGFMQSLSPAVMAGIGVYLMLMVLAGAYFMLKPSGNAGVQEYVGLEQIEVAVAEDIAAIDLTENWETTRSVLSDSPETFLDLKLLLRGTPNADERDMIASKFKAQVMRHFSEAWRLEKQGRWSDAVTSYEAVLAMLGDRHLKTTNIALLRMQTAQAQ